MSTQTSTTRGSRLRGTRWGDVLVGGIGLIIAAILFAGSASMEVRGQAVPGPQFFPVVVGILLAVVGGFLVIRAFARRERGDEEDVIRPDVSTDLLLDVSHADTQVISLKQDHHQRAQPSAVADADEAEREHFDWRGFGITAGAVAVFIVILPLVGWIIACTLLFAAVTVAFGSKRIVFNLAVGLLIGSIVQLVFSGLLGLALPAGFIGGLL